PTKSQAGAGTGDDDDGFDWFHTSDPDPDDEDVSDLEELEPRLRWCACFFERPPWVRCLMLLVPGLMVLFMPGVVAVMVLKKPGDKRLFDGIDGVGDLSLSTEVLRWSSWLSATWFFWVVPWYFIDALPYLIVQFCNKTLGGCSERVRSNLEYIVALKLFITILVWAILVVVFYALFFNQMNNVDFWKVGFNVLVTGLVFAICLFFQKLALQIIAVNFHRLAYKERIAGSKRAMKVLDRLRKSMKSRRQFNEYFVPAEVEAARAKKKAEEEKKLEAAKNSDADKSDFDGPHIIDGKEGERRRRSRNSGGWDTGTETSGDESEPEGSAGVKKKRQSKFWVSWMKRQAAPHEKEGESGAGDSSDISELRLQSLDIESSREKLNVPPPSLSTEDLPPPRPSGTLMSPRLSQIRSQESSLGVGPPPPPSVMRTNSTISRRRSVAAPYPLNIRPSRTTMSRSPTGLTSANSAAVLDAAIGNDDLESPVSAESGAGKDQIQPTISVLKDFQGKKYQKEIERMDVSSQRHAGKLAKKLFTSLGGKEKGEITVEDFQPYFPTPESALAAFSIFDADDNGSLTRRELKESIMHMYRERRGLFRALRDLSQAVGKLNRLFYVCSAFVTFCVALPVFGISLSAMLPFTSFLLALSFVFGGAAKMMFECLLFLFLTHPYDSGDRVIIDGQTLIVENVGVLSTVFKRVDGQIIYAPNSLISTKLIHNIRRSGDQSETIELHFDFYTPEEKIRTLRNRMLDFVQAESREFQPTCDIHVQEFIETNLMKVTVSLRHKGNWQDGAKRTQRRTRFMFALKKYIEELGITYTKPAAFPYPGPGVPPTPVLLAAPQVPSLFIAGTEPAEPKKV
ncbi:hypothetical protein HK104_004046, partial [Borealophlyctis nickersoniae]